MVAGWKKESREGIERRRNEKGRGERLKTQLKRGRERVKGVESGGRKRGGEVTTGQGERRTQRKRERAKGETP